MTRTMIMILGATSLTVAGCSSPRNDDTLRSAGTGAAIGAAGGAGLGAVVGGLSPITGAVVGAAVGGLAGAIWADRDNDGYADGYVREGQYYQGQPNYYEPAPQPTWQPAPAPAPTYNNYRRGGERG